MTFPHLGDLGDYPLLEAMWHCHNDVAKLLVKAGADADAAGKTYHGRTALALSAVVGNLVMTKYLIEAVRLLHIFGGGYKCWNGLLE